MLTLVLCFVLSFKVKIKDKFKGIIEVHTENKVLRINYNVYFKSNIKEIAKW
jgi:hypothetical protein